MSKSVDYDEEMTFEDFAKSARTTFAEELETSQRGFSCYFVTGDEPVTARKRISQDTFEECIDAYRNAPSSGPQPVIYFHDNTSSPQGSPKRVFASKQMIAPSESGESSVTSNRSGQKDYSDRVFRRDNGKCVFCGSSEGVMAAHVVEVKDGANVDDSMYENLHLSGLMDTSNGMLLCKPCHDQYDAYYVCLNADSIVEVSNALLHAENEQLKKKWTDLNKKKVRAGSEAGAWITKDALIYRYKVFRRETADRQANAKMLCFRCKRCNNGFETERGLNQHIKRGGRKCFLERSNRKHVVKKQQTPQRHSKNF